MKARICVVRVLVVWVRDRPGCRVAFGSMHITAGEVLTVRSHSSAAAIGLGLVIGGTRPNSNAAVAIEKLD